MNFSIAAHLMTWCDHLKLIGFEHFYRILLRNSLSNRFKMFDSFYFGSIPDGKKIQLLHIPIKKIAIIADMLI